LLCPQQCFVKFNPSPIVGLSLQNSTRYFSPGSLCCDPLLDVSSMTFFVKADPLVYPSNIREIGQRFVCNKGYGMTC